MSVYLVGCTRIVRDTNPHHGAPSRSIEDTKAARGYDRFAPRIVNAKRITLRTHRIGR